MADLFSTINEIKRRFPDLALIMDKEPEIAALLFAHGNDDPAIFQQALHQTNWWKTTPESARMWQVRSLKDPAWANQQRTKMATDAYAVASSLGIPIHYGDMAKIVEDALAQGWDTTQLTRRLTDEASFKKLRAGTLKETAVTLKGIAADYGISLSDKAAFDWSLKMADGMTNQQGFESYAREQAKLAFPGLAKELDQGMSVRQLADPYLQIAAELLGKDPNTMRLTDPKWRKAFQAKDKDGKPAGMMTHDEWQSTIMTDRRYGYDTTEHARTAAYELRDQLAETFGVKA